MGNRGEEVTLSKSLYKYSSNRAFNMECIKDTALLKVNKSVKKLRNTGGIGLLILIQS